MAIGAVGGWLYSRAKGKQAEEEETPEGGDTQQKLMDYYSQKSLANGQNPQDLPSEYAEEEEKK